jgi:ankyrin repeat protein
VNQTAARPELIDVLLDAGADIRAADPRDGSTLLHQVAVFDDDPELVSTALAAGAPLDDRDHRGRTPLHLAAESAHPKVAAALLDAGADAHATDDDGRRPIDLLTTNRFAAPEAVAAASAVLTPR